MNKQRFLEEIYICGRCDHLFKKWETIIVYGEYIDEGHIPKYYCKPCWKKEQK